MWRPRARSVSTSAGRAPLQTVGPVQGVPAGPAAVARRVATQVTEVVDGFEDETAIGFGERGHDVQGIDGRVPIRGRHVTPLTSARSSVTAAANGGPPAAERLPTPPYPSVTYGDGWDGDQASGGPRLGDHGLGARGGGGQGRVRGDRAVPPAASADGLLAGLARNLDRQVAKGKLDGRRAGRGAGSGLGHRPARRPRRVRSRDRVRGRGPHGQEGALRRARSVVQPDAIFASNTSTLPIVELAVQTQRPDQVCGLHFFNPAPS